MRRMLYLLIPLALVAAACGDDDATGASPHGEMASDAGSPGGGHMTSSPVPDGARTIEVTASSFEFDPETIEVEAGEPIAIELTATDAEHDFVIDDIELHVVAAGERETATGGFIVPAAGEYEFYCAVAGHRAAGMEGTLIVT